MDKRASALNLIVTRPHFIDYFPQAFPRAQKNFNEEVSLKYLDSLDMVELCMNLEKELNHRPEL